MISTKKEKEKIRKKIKKKRNKLNRKIKSQNIIENKIEINGSDNLDNQALLFKNLVKIENNELYKEIENKLYNKFNKFDEFLNNEDKDNLEDININTEENINNEYNLNRKKKKEKERINIAQLKVISNRPDLVESHDITAKDPLFLLSLKSLKNTVPVPNNWKEKKHNLLNTQRYYRRIFKLPDHIEKTGISKLRDPMQEKDTIKMIKQKIKERMNPRLNKIDIDYEVLYNAFFKEEFKPQLTIHGDFYYEGKDDENKIKNMKPGIISQELRTALGMSENIIPPWIRNMQKFGPPPSYPNYKIARFENLEKYKDLLDKKTNNKHLNNIITNLIGNDKNNIFEKDKANTNYLWGQINN